MPAIQVEPVTHRRALRVFVEFPWRIYQHDPNWVPPLISERLTYLDPARGPFYRQADVALFLARRGREVVGTIAAFVDHRRLQHLNLAEGGFGFFETIEEYAVAEHLLHTACDWLRAHGMSSMRGPTNFGEQDSPGVLIDGADRPPAMLEAHTPPYYQRFLERYGMEKDHDLYAWRYPCGQIGADLRGLPPDIARVAEVARRVTNVTIRRARPENWDRELSTVRDLFNATLHHIPDHVPMSESEFGRFANQMRPFIDPDLVQFAEVDGKAVGYCVAIPDINHVLIHLNGRLFPLNWLKVGRLIRQIDVVSFKLMGVLEEYRRRGIEALLFLEALRTTYQKGYKWLDGSITSEWNPGVNLLAHRLGAERYKHFRLYRIGL